MNILYEVIFIIVSFAIGSISSAIIICHLLKLPNPRELGSKNPGATNVLRLAGKKVAAVVLALDMLKGFIPVSICLYFGFSLFTASLVGIATFIGHIYPVWFNFKGGKGVATFLGVLLALNFTSGFFSAIIWFFVAIILKTSSLSALVSTVLAPFLFYYFSYNTNASIVVVIMTVLVFWTHRDNINRLINKKEKNIGN